MKFKMNNNNWKIEEISQEEIRNIIDERAKKKIENEPELGRYLGITFSDIQVIYIDKDLPIDRKEKTLIHELTHCYIDMYVTHMNKNYTEEDVCDINANSYNFIHKIINKYFTR